MARLTMGKTKAEIGDMVEQLEADDVMRPMMEGISSTETRMRRYHELASAVWVRLMCAAIVIALGEDGRTSV